MTDDATLVLRLHPAIQRLEDLFLINSWIFENRNPEKDHHVELACQVTFGIIDSSLDLQEPSGGEYVQWSDEKQEEFELRWNRYYQQFKTVDMDDIQIVDHFDNLGIDARNEYGKPLRCLLDIASVVEAAHLGIAGALPKQAELLEIQITNSLNNEKHLFLKSRK